MKTIAALLPTFGSGSGGVRTVLNNLSALARNGFECHIYVEGNTTDAELRETLHNSYDCGSLVPHVGCRVALDHDLVMATMWHTALALGTMPGNFKKVYLAQDYEPFFYPMGGHFVMAEHSYAQGLQVITMGRWLADKLHREFGVTARIMDFCANLDTYHPTPPAAAKEFAIAVLYQPDKPHRAIHTVLSALSLVKAVLPHLTIYTFGSAVGPASPATKHLGIISPDQLNALYNHCQLGLCISMTNPSRIPFEMMAAGLPVIEADRENNLFDLPNGGVVRTRLAAEPLRETMIDLLADEPQCRTLAQAGTAFMQQRPARLEQEQFCQHIQEILEGKTKKYISLAPVKAAACQRMDRSQNGARYDLVTVDVWDTLLRRRCHPDEIKRFTARYLLFTHAKSLKPGFNTVSALVGERVRCERAIGQQRQQGGLDDEYSIREVLRHWLAAVLTRLPLAEELAGLADQLNAAEVQQEKNCLYPDAEIIATLENIPAKQRLFLSDFYMPAPMIKELIEHAGLAHLIPDGVVSCDLSLNKRTGRLFRKIQEMKGVAPARHFHLGDNEYSDYFIPRTLGMAAAHYFQKTESPKLERFNLEYATRDGQAGFAPREIRAIAQLGSDRFDLLAEPDAMFQFGAAAAPLLAGFALFVAEEAIKLGLPKLYFFTREGEFFAKVYSELAKLDPFGIPFPEPVVIEVSRLATFTASLNRIDLAEFMRLWNMYSSQSLRSFFTSLDFDPAPLAKLISSYGITLDEVIRFPWADPRLRQLFTDGRFTQTLAQVAAEKRALLLDYLRTKGIHGDEDQLGIVDIGWRGTIQDNLAWVLNRTKVYGWFLGMLPFLNPQPPNATKAAYGPGRAGDNAEVKRLLDFVSPLEMLCNSASGSTLRYERQNGTVVAQREKNPREELVFEKFTRHFQAGLLSQLGLISQTVRHRAIAALELRPLALEILSHIVHDPPSAAATAYFTLNHNETFGTGQFDDKQRYYSEISSIRDYYFTGELDNFERRLGETTWPQGFAKLCGIRFPFFHATSPAPVPLPVAVKRAARLIGNEALEFYLKGKYQSARKLALKSLAINPWRLKLHYLAYRACLQQNEIKAAMQHFRLIRLLNPKHPPSFNEFAARAWGVGLDVKGSAIFEMLVGEQPDYRPALLNYCRSLFREGKPVPALALLEEQRERFAGDAEFQQFLAFARVVAGRALLAAADTQLLQFSAVGWAGLPPFAQFHHQWRESGDSLTRIVETEIESFLLPKSDDEYLGIPSPVPVKNASPRVAIVPSLSAVKISGAVPAPSVTAALKPAKANSRYWLQVYEAAFASHPDVQLPIVTNADAALPSAGKTPAVSIIIPTFNRLDLTRACLAAFSTSTNRQNCELIVVDNGSTDGTVDFLKSEAAAGRLRVLSNSKNLGFAKACNQGAQAARGRYVLFLNNDTEVQPDWLDPLVAIADADATVAAVGSKLLFPNGTLQHAGVAIGEVLGRDPLLAVHAFYQAPADLPEANQRRVYQALTAACLLVRKSAFETVGRFDEGFWNGYEDVDLCFRFQEQGWLMVYEPASVVIHHESKSGPARFQKVQDNIRRLHQKWLGKVKLDVAVAADGAVTQAATTRIHPYIPGPARAAFTSIVILCYNQLAHTKTCLESIARHTSEPYELILVDNASTDGTLPFLQEYAVQHERVLVVTNRTNRGFAAGNNQGMALATGRQVLLLNNDTVVTPGWLGNMLEVLRVNPATGVVGPRSNRILGRQQVDEVGYKTLAELPAFAAAWAEKNKGASQPANRVVGFCLLARREVIDAIGGLDEQFGSGNFEDDDFCIRAHLAGFETRIADDSFVHHVGNATFNGAGINYSKAMQTNWSLFKRKWAIPPETPPFPGYLTPDVAPPGVALKVSLPELKLTHQSSANGRCWMDKVITTTTAKPKPIVLPPCALVGHLAGARDLLRQKKLPAAWTATRTALKQRPFHPEAYLLLAEIALAAQASVAARDCAQFARRIAPDFRAAKKFLKGKFHGHAKPEWLLLPEEIGNHKSERRRHLSVCLIVKNEEKFLGQCLTSVRGLADQIVVVDTGSTDRTIEIAREHGAQVHAFAWGDDFSAARNAALEHATGDWILMLDADEELPPENHAALRHLLRSDSVMAWRLPIIDVGREAEGCCYVPRLFRNAPALFYVSRVHEQVFSSIEVRRQEWGLENRLGDAALRHHGYRPDVIKDRNKIERNLRLLEQAIIELPDEPNLLMNYGLELARSGHLDAGVKEYWKAFEIMSGQTAEFIVPEMREMLLMQLSTQLMAQRRFDEIIRLLTSPLARGAGLTASLHFSLGLAQLELKQFSAAADQMRQCLAKRDQPALSPVNQEIRKAGPRHCLALCLEQLGDPAAAAEEFRLVLEADPQSRSLRCDYARFLAANERQVEALNLYFALAGEQPDESPIWIQGGQLALSQPGFLEVALDWTAEAERHRPGDPAVIQQRAEALLLAGQCAAALPLWRRLPASSNPVIAAALVICETVVGENQFSPAAAEPAVSREFIQWYQRLLRFTERPTLEALNTNLARLERSLPSAAGILAGALAEVADPAASSAQS